jgi:TolA-binding protein
VASWRPGGRLTAVAGAIAVLAGCAPESAPLFREDFDRLRADLQRVEQEVQGSRSTLQTEIQATDRRTTQTLTEIQRSQARLGTRLDELGREATQLQGRVDELRRRVDTLALQFETGGPPPTGGSAAPGAPPAGAAQSSAGPAQPSTGAAQPPAGAAQSSTGAAQPPAGAAQRPATPGTQASDLYQTAYIDFTRGHYNLAAAAFREYIRLYPTTALAEKAQFWIGESHFSLARAHQAKGEANRAVQELERAVQEFRKVVITYPRGDRVPAALYKEALALGELGQIPLAEARLQFLIDQFPSTEEAAQARDQLARIRKR